MLQRRSRIKYQRNISISSNQSVTNVNLVDEAAVDSFPVNIKTDSEHESSLIIESAYINCTDMVSNIEGHAIKMYDTNPNYNLAGRLRFNWYFVTMFWSLRKFAT